MKTSKKALFGSILSLLLCCSMLIGTTFAWFTDEVSSGVNTIQSGTLKIGVEYTQDGTTWKDLDSVTDLFSGALWEPGHTRVVALKLTNEGSLALKYKVGMNIVSEKAGTNVNGEAFKLSDYLEVSTLIQQANDPQGIGDVTLYCAFLGENVLGYEDTNKLNEVSRESTLFSGDSHYLIIKVDMPASVGNEANAQLGKEASIQFGISVVAAQAAFESDSFNNQYDKDAEYDLVDLWDGTADTSWYDAGNTGVTTYNLASAEQLAGLAKLVSEGNDFEGKKIVLDTSVDLSGTEWTPIGGFDASNDFKGEFDGQGQAIIGLNIDKSDAQADEKLRLGLFASPIAYIHDVTIIGASISAPENGTNVRAGALAGNLWYSGNTACVVENVTVDGFVFNGGDDATPSAAYKLGGLAGYGIASEIKNVTVKDFVANVEINKMGAGASDHNQIGGMFGLLSNDCTFENCVVDGFKINAASAEGLTGAYAAIGGFVGETNGSGGAQTYRNCQVKNLDVTVAGSIEYRVGGFYGKNSSYRQVFENCSAEGKIINNSTVATTRVGGFVGYAEVWKGPHTYTDCSVNVAISGNDAIIGGFIGEAHAYYNVPHISIKGCTSTDSLHPFVASETNGIVVEIE